MDVRSGVLHVLRSRTERRRSILVDAQVPANVFDLGLRTASHLAREGSYLMCFLWWLAATLTQMLTACYTSTLSVFRVY